MITCANITAEIENFIVSSRVNYVYMALSPKKFVLLNLPIFV